MDVTESGIDTFSNEEQQKKVDLVKKVREKMELPIAIMLDTKGPEYRIKTFADGKVMLEDGQDFTLTTDEIQGDASRVSVSYKNLVNELSVGDRVLVNNGLIILEVKELKRNDAVCKVIAGGVLSDR